MIGEFVFITGQIFTGRDAILPRLVDSIVRKDSCQICINFQDSVIFHTAVSPAGVGPTTSNKLEIECSMPELAKAGVRLHIGKGAISQETVDGLHRYESIYAVTPPLTALFESKIMNKKMVAFHEEGMEAMHLLEVINFPVIIAAAHGKSLFS